MEGAGAPPARDFNIDAVRNIPPRKDVAPPVYGQNPYIQPARPRASAPEVPPAGTPANLSAFVDSDQRYDSPRMASVPSRTVVPPVTAPGPSVNQANHDSMALDFDVVPRASAPAARPDRPGVLRQMPARDTNISGPSFLGIGALDDERPGGYLLDDQNDSGAWRKWVALLIILGVVAIAYMNWPKIYAAFERATRPAADNTLVDAPKSDVASAPAANPDNANNNVGITDSKPAAEGEAKAAADQSKTAADSSANADVKKNPSSAPEPPADTGSAAASGAAKAGAPVNQAAAGATELANTPSATQRQSRSSAADADPETAESTDAAPARPSAADVALLTRAQNYLQGRGVPQDCATGLSLLRSAAARPNPRARVQMAALYATGHCAPYDPVQAYQWFGSAMELDPHNSFIQRNRSTLYANMNAEERRRATAESPR